MSNSYVTFTHLCIHAVHTLTTVLHQPFMADDWKTKPIKKQASNHPPDKLAGSVPRFGCLLRTVPLSFNLFFCSVFQLLCTCNTFHHLTLSIFLQFEASSLQLHKYISVQSALSVKAGVLKRSAGCVPVIKGQTSTEWILPQQAQQLCGLWVKNHTGRGGPSTSHTEPCCCLMTAQTINHY